MSTRSTLNPMRLLITAAGLVVVVMATFALLPARREKYRTVGWVFADGVAAKKLASGEGSRQDPDPLWRDAAEVLASAPGIDQPSNPRAPHPVASHVEPKAAIWMRQNGITHTVGVAARRPDGIGHL